MTYAIVPKGGIQIEAIGPFFSKDVAIAYMNEHKMVATHTVLSMRDPWAV